jgi:methyl-accepting chemotaxis protein
MSKILEYIRQDIDKLAEKTGEEAKKINTKIKNDLDSVAKSTKSINLKNDLQKLAKKGDELVDKTGSSAGKLASEMKADLNSIKERIDLTERFEKLGVDLDNLVDKSGTEVNKLLGKTDTIEVNIISPTQVSPGAVMRIRVSIQYSGNYSYYN